jgi:catechol 2,3-dioxygenase-like lactoylglutathione lyase family enzyme
MLPLELGAVVIDCPDVPALASFYCKMLGWESAGAGRDWLEIAPPGGGVRIAFQKKENYQPPLWPEEPPGQQQMLHLDFKVKDKEAMEKAAAYALSCGAKKAGRQYGDTWTVMLDPAGHPFCFACGY